MLFARQVVRCINTALTDGPGQLSKIEMSTPAPLDNTAPPHRADRDGARDPQASPAPGAATSTICHDMVRAVSLAPTVKDALDALFELLQDFGVAALALETSEDSLTRLHPHGDISALIAANEA